MMQPVKGPQVRCAKTLIRVITVMKRDTIREVVQQPISWVHIINHSPKPKIVQLERWKKQKLFSDGLNEGL